MKYPSSLLGLIAFTAAMVWSWNVIHSESSVSFEIHSGLQERMSSLITDTIKAKKPSATGVKIEQIWTELMGKDKVKAHFTYSFKENGESGPLTTTIKGESILERKADDGSGKDNWTLSKFTTTNDTVVFEDGLVVSPDDTGSPTNNSAPEEKSENGESAE